jgi:hypothetical protein
LVCKINKDASSSIIDLKSFKFKQTTKAGTDSKKIRGHSINTVFIIFIIIYTYAKEMSSVGLIWNGICSTKINQLKNWSIESIYENYVYNYAILLSIQINTMWEWKRIVEWKLLSL